MKKYNVIVKFSIDDVYEIEAESKEDAILHTFQQLDEKIAELRFDECEVTTTIEVEEIQWRTLGCPDTK